MASLDLSSMSQLIDINDTLTVSSGLSLNIFKRVSPMFDPLLLLSHNLSNTSQSEESDSWT